MGFEPGNERVGLQAREQEYQTLDEVDQEVPEKYSLQTRGRADEAQAIPTDVKTGGHRRQDSRSAQQLGRPVRQKWGQHREHDLHSGIAYPTAQSQHGPTNNQSPHQLADQDGDKLADRVGEREGTSQHRGDSEAIQNQ